MKKIKQMFLDIKRFDKSYQEGKSLIDDKVFDNLKNDFILEIKRDPQSATKEMIDYLGTSLPDIHLEGKKKIKHPYPILSLAKTQTIEGLKDFLDKWNNSDKNATYYTDKFLVERKEDGLTVVLYFNDEHMPNSFTALTRGGGQEGQDITDKIKNFINLDLEELSSKIKDKHVVIRGEAIIDDKDFDEINNDNRFANSRNAASGTLMAKDNELVKKNKMKFYAYELVNHEDFDLNRIQELEYLGSLGIEITGDVSVFENSQKGKSLLIKYVERYDDETRKSIGHGIDGLVIKPNYLKNLDKIGYTGHHPNSDFAYKFKAEECIAILEKVEWQKSINGKLTPVGILDHPVELLGAKIERASLASIQNIERREIKLYDHVIIRRSNDVIPQIVSPVKELRNGKEKDIHETIPKDAIRKGAVLYSEPDKKQQLFQSWIKFVGKEGLNLDGVSGQTIKILLDNQLIDLNDYSSIWRINKEKFISIKGLGEKKYDILMKELDETKPDLRNLFLMLPIEGLGFKLADIIASQLEPDFVDQDPEELSSKTSSNVSKLKGFGTKSKEIINELFTQENLDKLKKIGKYIPLKHYVREDKHEGKLSNEHFVITGRFDKTRKEITEMIATNGGIIDSSIKDSTDYLLKNGNRESNKTKAAKEHNVRIIDWNEFLSMIEK